MGNKIPLLMVATVMTLVSCGSKKRATTTPLPPGRSVAEISLDELVGRGTFVMTPDEDLSSQAKALVDAAHKWLGTAYRYGGESRSGVDCSALVMNVYREALGLKIPRTTRSQRQYAAYIQRDDLQPGDLIFFSSNKNRKGISHVGMFIGSDRFIHASSSRGVVVSKLSEKYFMTHYHSSGRVACMASGARGVGMAVVRQGIPDSVAERRLEILDEILTATIDSIYAMPVDDDPNLAPGL